MALSIHECYGKNFSNLALNQNNSKFCTYALAKQPCPQPKMYQRERLYGLPGNSPILNPGGTRISHICLDTCEGGIKSSVSYIGSAVPDPTPGNTFTGLYCISSSKTSPLLQRIR